MGRRPLIEGMIRGVFGDQDIAVIRLLGDRYEQQIDGEYVSSTDTLTTLAKASEYDTRVDEMIRRHEQDLQPLIALGFHGLDAKIKSPQALSYEEAFSLATFVCLASNKALHRRLKDTVGGAAQGLLDDPRLVMDHGISFLQSMSTREGIMGLAPQEIAGMVAAVVELDTVIRVRANPEGKPVFAVGGMGGDRGLTIDGAHSKLFSVSTINALLLSDFSLVHKHHSYPNTSKVSGQSAIEAFGARSDFERPEDMERILSDSGILMTSCHSTRSIHTISHRLKGETINHVIGPAAFPHNGEEALSAVIGVNHNVHPQTYIDALNILSQKGVQCYGNSVAFCGIDKEFADVPLRVIDPEQYYRDQSLKALVAMDEVPPPPFTTMASFLVDGKAIGTFLLEPIDFMPDEDLAEIDIHNIVLPNTAVDITQVNQAVIQGNDTARMRYAAMTSALALFTTAYGNRPDAFDHVNKRVNRRYLRECYEQSYASLATGATASRLERYAEATKERDMLPGIDAVIVDMDLTLVRPKDVPSYYGQFPEAVHRAITRYLSISMEEAIEVADFYRREFRGGEHALFSGSIDQYFPQYGKHDPNFTLLHEEISSVDPTGQFVLHEHERAFIGALRAQGKKVVLLTDNTDIVAQRVLREAGFSLDDFDYIFAYTREHGPLKIVQGAVVFTEIAKLIGVPPERVLSIGDTPRSDIEPAEKAGMKTCLVAQDPSLQYEGLTAPHITHVGFAYRRSV